MKIIKRTCATCSAFNPAPEDNDPTCWKLVTIAIHKVGAFNVPIVVRQWPHAGFLCESHKTDDEDRAEAAAIGAFWFALGITPRHGRQDDFDGLDPFPF
ncbi:MAG: hypothetical protein HQ446_07100 [Polaromonas sp.]|nr:hypothetical protein [Polaromonas sp.]